MRAAWPLFAALLVWAGPTLADQPAAKPPPAPEEITVIGQRPVAPVTPNTSYWTEDAFATYPLLGANFAKGLIIWNHPEPGIFNGPSIPPIRAMEGLAALGWDITRLQRNGRLSNGWENKYERVRGELAHQVADAKAQGYKRIILAGQEMGGGLALEAGKETDGLYAIIALAPNTGVAWMGAPRQLINIPTDGNGPIILKHTWDQMEHTKAGRLMVFFPDADEEVPHERGPTAREILGKRGDIPFLLVDEASHVRGTAGADKPDFDAYASCMDQFLSPDLTPRPGEFHCGADEVPLTLAQMGVKPRGGETWFGYSSRGQAIYLELPPGGHGSLTYGWGAGANGKTKPGFKDLDAKFAGDVFTADLAPDQGIRGVRYGAVWRLTVDQEDGTRAATVMHRLPGNS
jgi:dienelactone hydrolase